MDGQFKADLHCHTKYSDGTDDINEILQCYYKNSIAGISLTDHDNIDIYKKINLKNDDILLINGVEFSCLVGNNEVHILAYGFNCNNEYIINLCNKHKVRRENRIFELVYRLNKDFNFNIKNEGVCYRLELAINMVRNNLCKNVNECFKYFNKYKYLINFEGISIKETLDFIHNANALAIVAHPYSYKSHTVDQILNYNIDGIECYYSGKNFYNQKRFIKYCNQKNLIITGGSDYHGDNKKNILGSSWTDLENFNYILDIQKSNK